MNTPTDVRPLRLWPGVVILIVQWGIRFGVPVVAPDYMPFAVLGGMAGSLAIVLWWLFLSRAPWSERLGAVVFMAIALFATRPILHESIATGAMGMLFFILAAPVLSLALVVWAAFSRSLSAGPRWVTMGLFILLACGSIALIRTGGFTASFDNDIAWRWSATPEQRLLAQPNEEPRPPAPAPVAPAATVAADVTAPVISAPKPTKPVEWPGFRGADRDGIVRGVRIETDWTASPPVELWRRSIGPGWSSFAVSGDLIYTQEQRGDDEIVSCYNRNTGEPVWRHRDATRFYESNGGPGPRGTPTLSGGRAYTFGATGILNALDAATGAVLWSRNAASHTGAQLPDWGFSSSPLILDDLVIVASSGQLAAYDAANGEPRWIRKTKGGSYSSPHLATIGGVPQILLLNSLGAMSAAPSDGMVLWEHAWSGFPIVQPALTPDGDILITTNGSGMGGVGTRRIAVASGPDGWTVEERWTSTGLKPYFNDFVVHEGHVYGFDGSILASIDLKDGARKWKGGRYGNGQLVLLRDQGLLLVLSESGEIALVRAAPDQFTELARVPVLQGKTWNHPVVTGDTLLLRNGEEMAAFRLPLAKK